MKSMPLAAALLLSLAGALGAAPTATPTPTTCLTPGPGGSFNLASGCYGTSNSVTYNATAAWGSGPGLMLLVHIENGVAGALPLAVSFGGQALTLIRTDPTFSGGSLAAYYLLNPPAGVNNLVVTYAAAGCDWNLAGELIFNVDPVSPIGGTSSSTGNAASFSTNVAVTRPSSLLSDFFAFGGSVTVTNADYWGFGFAYTDYQPASGCCDYVFGQWAGGSSITPGVATMPYTLSAATQYTDQLIEIRGVDCSAGATPTPTDTVLPTPTFSPTPTDTAAVPTPLPAGCVTPGFTNAVVLASGCYTASNSLTCSAVAFGAPTNPETLLLLRISNTNGALPSSIRYAGQALTLIRSDPTFDGGVLASYYLLAPASGVNNLVVDYAAPGCGWFITASDYFNVDPKFPIGSSLSQTGNAASFSYGFICSLPCSILTDFFTSAAAVSVSGPLLGEPYTSGCCDNPQGLWMAGSSVPYGFQTLSFTLNAATSYTHQFIEIHGVPCGVYVSETPTPPPASALNRLQVFPNLIRGAGAGAKILVYSPRGGFVQVRIIRSNGRPLRNLWKGVLTPGASPSLDWDGLDDSGAAAGSGVYYVVFIDGDGSRARKKVIVLR
jgi:hypothetical protein